MIWLEKKKRGGWAVWLIAAQVRELLELPGRLRELLESQDFTDKVVARLFPQAYTHNAEAEAEYQRLSREDLRRRKLETVETFERTLKGRESFKTVQGPSLARVELSDEELAYWLGFLHDMRMMIGTRLDITDETWEAEVDPADPNAAELELLHRLTAIEGAVVDAVQEAERLD